MSKIILLSLLFIFPQDLGELKQKANNALDKAEQKVMKINPDPDKPDVEECPCNGKGYIVHGDGHKTKCPGTSDGPCQYQGQIFGDVNLKEMTVTIDGITYKLVEVNSSSQKREHGVVELYTADWCGPCQRLKSNVTYQNFLNNLRNNGWTIRTIKVDRNQRLENPLPYAKILMRGEANIVPVLDNAGNLFFNVDLINRINKKYK